MIKNHLFIDVLEKVHAFSDRMGRSVTVLKAPFSFY